MRPAKTADTYLSICVVGAHHLHLTILVCSNQTISKTATQETAMGQITSLTICRLCVWSQMTTAAMDDCTLPQLNLLCGPCILDSCCHGTRYEQSIRLQLRSSCVAFTSVCFVPLGCCATSYCIQYNRCILDRWLFFPVLICSEN